MLVRFAVEIPSGFSLQSEGRLSIPRFDVEIVHLRIQRIEVHVRILRFPRKLTLCRFQPASFTLIVVQRILADGNRRTSRKTSGGNPSVQLQLIDRVVGLYLSAFSHRLPPIGEAGELHYQGSSLSPCGAGEAGSSDADAG
ncbi:hypothetical protein D3C76_1069510 [compost metagenome]